MKEFNHTIILGDAKAMKVEGEIIDLTPNEQGVFCPTKSIECNDVPSGEFKFKPGGPVCNTPPMYNKHDTCQHTSYDPTKHKFSEEQIRIAKEYGIGSDMEKLMNILINLSV